jgi:hypothetical protein
MRAEKGGVETTCVMGRARAALEIRGKKSLFGDILWPRCS